MPMHLQTHQSREYWARPIELTYPGEGSSSTAKRAYKQRLNAYLTKCAPIWDIVTDTTPCPLASDHEAIASMKSLLGDRWEFDPKDITSTLNIIKPNNREAHDRVKNEMNAGTDQPAGSWTQRNSALYSTICDTLDLSSNGRDLDILNVVEENNGIALYHLMYFRLREVKSSDPMARAMKLKMGLEHIKYIVKPHGVASYFAAIKSHRTKLASLPKPKYISDWEVVAKALQELPPLHAKFESSRNMLELQRKLYRCETSLSDCMDSFINAEIDNDVYEDLKPKTKKPKDGDTKPPTNKKRKILLNLAQRQKRGRGRGTEAPNITIKYPEGSCAHHPNSTSHVSKSCSNPFGFGSIFGKAAHHADKCAAVRASIAAGWSPKATWIQIPDGFGSPQRPASNLHTSATLNTNQLAIPVNAAPSTLSSEDINAYNRVRAAMDMETRAQLPPTPHPPPQPPLRALHVANRLGYPHQRSPYYYPPRRLYSPHRIDFHHRAPDPYAAPSPIRANMMHVPRGAAFPPATEDDAIAAGMHYYANQTGQDFR